MTPPPSADLTIGDVAARTQLSPATLRMWEQRYGFPVPQRLPSGHRRYALADVDVILDVLRRRAAGVRLEAAVAQAQRASEAAPEAAEASSVFAELSRLHPGLGTHRLRKETLLGLSWAIEDEFCSRAERSYLFAGFQRAEFLAAALPRWNELARTARAAYVFADDAVPAEPAEPAEPASRLVAVPLTDTTPLSREWLVVCDAPGLAAALSAWELPGQDGVPERERTFETTWTLEPAAVRDAARVCARVAAALDAGGATDVVRALDDAPVASHTDPRAASAMHHRVVVYLDRMATRSAESSTAISTAR